MPSILDLGHHTPTQYFFVSGVLVVGRFKNPYI